MATTIIKTDDFYLKREDQNLTGSVKDRAVELQVRNLTTKGIKHAVISSTGNAAISADFYCQQHGIDLTVFVSPKINPHKLNLIKHSHIIKSDQPISDAFKYAKYNNYAFLRQSTDPIAQEGYSQIAVEIKKQLPQVSSIFLPVGSGTTLLGIASKLPPFTKIFAVQPSSNPTIAKYFQPNILTEHETITDALSVRMIPQKAQILSVIKKSKGSGLAVLNQHTVNAWQLLKLKHIFTSPEGALALAGYYQACQSGLEVGEHPLIILTGSDRSLYD